MPAPSLSHPWRPHAPLKRLLLWTHFTDEVSEVRGGCDRQVVEPNLHPLGQAAPQRDTPRPGKEEKQDRVPGGDMAGLCGEWGCGEHACGSGGVEVTRG